MDRKIRREVEKGVERGIENALGSRQSNADSTFVKLLISPEALLIALGVGSVCHSFWIGFCVFAGLIYFFCIPHIGTIVSIIFAIFIAAYHIVYLVCVIKLDLSPLGL